MGEVLEFKEKPTESPEEFVAVLERAGLSCDGTLQVSYLIEYLEKHLPESFT